MSLTALSFENMAKGIRAIPNYGSSCAAKEFMKWTNEKGLNRSVIEMRDDKTWKPSDFNSETIACSITRAVLTALIFPVLATVSATYNAAVGLAKIGLGVITHMQIDPQNNQVDVLRNEARNTIKSGIEHLLVAVYDFAIGVFSTVIALIYGISAQAVQTAHERICTGYTIRVDDEEELSDDENSPQNPAWIEIGAQKTVDGFFPQPEHAGMSFWDRINPFYQKA